MNLVTQEAIGSIYLRIEKLRNSAAKARDKARDTRASEQKRLILCGKVTAYTDVLCMLKCRYDGKMTFPHVDQTWDSDRLKAFAVKNTDSVIIDMDKYKTA